MVHDGDACSAGRRQPASAPLNVGSSALMGYKNKIS